MKILEHINEHKHSIFMHSDVYDIYQEYLEYIMLYINENSDKNIIFYSPYSGELNYIKECIKDNYKENLVDANASRKFICKNNNNIFFTTLHKHIGIGFATDIVFILSAGYVQKSIMTNFYMSIYPTINSRANSKLIISSVLTNKKSWFYEKFKDAENGKNDLKHKRLYFWEFGHKKYDGDWVSSMIKSIGEKEFNLKFNLTF